MTYETHVNTAADCTCSAKHELAFKLVSEILHARVDGSDMVSFDGVVLGSFVAQVRGIRFYNFGVSGACRGESEVVGRRPDNVHNVNCLDVALVRRTCVLCVVCVAQPAVNFATHYTLFAPHWHRLYWAIKISK